MMGFFGGKKFNVDSDIPDLSGKVILITGGFNRLNQTLSSLLLISKSRNCWSWQGIPSCIRETQAKTYIFHWAEL